MSLWLWRGLAAVALIGPLAWEPPYTIGVALGGGKRLSETFCSLQINFIIWQMRKAAQEHSLANWLRSWDSRAARGSQIGRAWHQGSHPHGK